MPSYVAFLRAIGPAAHKVMPMAALREACMKAGFKDARTFIATGNVLFSSSAREVAIVKKLAGVVRSFGPTNDVFVRTREEIAALLAGNPFPDAARDHPNHLLVLLLAGAVNARELERWPGPECVVAKGWDIYIDFPADIGNSKLTPAVIERKLGVPGTARNWNTMSKLAVL